MDAEFLVALTTFETPDQARDLVRDLVADGLIACGNVLPGATSIFRWQGAVQMTGEVLAIMKLRADAWPALEQRVRERHPYEVPELIALPVVLGSSAYLAWLRGEGETV